MNADITIGSPVLEAGEKFDIRYRQLPNGNWNDFGVVGNQSFTITDLDPGDYEVEITYILKNGTECPPVIKTFTVPDTWPPPVTCDCIDVTSSYIENDCDGISTLKIEYTDSTIAGCGCLVTTKIGAAQAVSVGYATLPNPLLIPVSSSENVHVKIELLCCDSGNWITCYDANIVDIRNCVCDYGPSITSDGSTYDPVADIETYFVVFSGSSPDVAPYNISLTILTGYPGTYTKTVNSPGRYEIQLPRGARMTNTQYYTEVSNRCGSDHIDGDNSPSEGLDLTVIFDNSEDQMFLTLNNVNVSYTSGSIYNGSTVDLTANPYILSKDASGTDEPYNIVFSVGDIPNCHAEVYASYDGTSEVLIDTFAVPGASTINKTYDANGSADSILYRIKFIEGYATPL